MKAIIVGGGIGGLSAAIALRRAGVEATVCERTGKLGEIGAGISLWANAMKALRKLGLYDAVQRRAHRRSLPSGSRRSARIRPSGVQSRGGLFMNDPVRELILDEQPRPPLYGLHEVV